MPKKATMYLCRFTKSNAAEFCTVLGILSAGLIWRLKNRNTFFPLTIGIHLKIKSNCENTEVTSHSTFSSSHYI